MSVLLVVCALFTGLTIACLRCCFERSSSPDEDEWLDEISRESDTDWRLR